MYRKNSKNWDTIMITVIVVKVERYGFTPKRFIQKGGDGIANSVDQIRLLHKEQYDLGQHCLLRPICPNT